jgi:hypothetical protein
MRLGFEVSKISFHEASIVGVTSGNESVCLSLEGIHVGDQTRKALICFNGLRQLIRDGAPVHQLGMEYPDGEVLTFAPSPESITLVVQWNDFPRKLERIVSYRVMCDSVEIV